MPGTIFDSRVLFGDRNIAGRHSLTVAICATQQSRANCDGMRNQALEARPVKAIRSDFLQIYQKPKGPKKACVFFCRYGYSRRDEGRLKGWLKPVARLAISDLVDPVRIERLQEHALSIGICSEKSVLRLK
ncbi:hypothetical protein [Roseibium sp.]|uniref:hypothetical protein n=1 Tax=Roseibium sp. TaxID=1936156 RepID=UPI003BA93599